MSKDRIYQASSGQIVDFVFDARVVAVFPDMIRRSVPGYETVLPLSGLLAARHMRRFRRCYDLGCSLGATALAVLRNVDSADARVIAVDNSAAMLARARTLHEAESRIEWVEADLLDTPIIDADAVVMNYTLQFVTPAARLGLLARIRTSLAPEGALIVSEKIRFEDAVLQSEFEAAHLDFKRANGYSEMEISGKRTALEKTLLPDTESEHHERFAQAGFRQSHVWFRCLNWASFIAYP
ncbi:MAG: carboxy-S-adenosyl-L-methionine synthase CmoA [Gammaproteobacteria bacterium]|nr:carboxy-S-adenosyl-L-methionine synthase CmoA [Gammaproteobacteria bacterium]